jgi:hypothetical protein
MRTISGKLSHGYNEQQQRHLVLEDSEPGVEFNNDLRTHTKPRRVYWCDLVDRSFN